jgi:hypothetical protein
MLRATGWMRPEAAAPPVAVIGRLPSAPVLGCSRPQFGGTLQRVDMRIDELTSHVRR